MNKRIASNLADLADELDLNNQFEQADQITELLKLASYGDQDSIKTAGVLDSALELGKNTWQGVKDFGQKAWTTMNKIEDMNKPIDAKIKQLIRKKLQKTMGNNPKSLFKYEPPYGNTQPQSSPKFIPRLNEALPFETSPIKPIPNYRYTPKLNEMYQPPVKSILPATKPASIKPL